MSCELSRSKQQVKRLKDSLNKRRFIRMERGEIPLHQYLPCVPFNCRFIKETLVILV